MEILNNLEKLGLNKHESKIYLTLLKIGESTAVTISNKIGSHRRTVYDTLENLIKKGLVYFKIKKYIKHFGANDPSTLKHFLEEKSFILKEILPKLKDSYKEHKKQISINILTGLEGAKTILTDAVEQNKPLYMIGGGMFILNNLKYSKKYIQKQFKKLKWKMIQIKRLDIKERLKGFESAEIKFLPEKYLSPVAIATWGDRALILLSKEELILIYITGKDYANAFKNYFNLLWKIAKK